MEKHRDFLKEGLGIFQKESIMLILDQWSFDKSELISNVINHMEKEGRKCVFVGTLSDDLRVSIDGKEYSVNISNYGNSYSLMTSQKIILTPQ